MTAKIPAPDPAYGKVHTDGSRSGGQPPGTNAAPAPAWAIEEACRRLNAAHKHAYYSNEHCSAPAITLLADMIAKYETPPVDPDEAETEAQADDSWRDITWLGHGGHGAMLLKVALTVTPLS